MHTLEITIQRKGETGWPVVVEQTRPGTFLPVRREGTLSLDEATEQELKTHEYVDPQQYGTALGKALFRENVRDALKEARAQDDGDLRVLLVVEAPDLVGYRWERLCAPIGTNGSWTFLTQDQRAPFSRYLPSLTDRRFRAIGKQDLRALVVVANPPEGNDFKLDRFEEAEMVAGIQAALGDIPRDLLASTEGASGPPTLGALVDRISGERYTLLHVVAHGAVTGSGDTVLYLLNEARQVEPVTGERFINRLQQIEGALGLPHLAFLATCDSASPEAETALGGLGQKLVRELGMPAVVAMTERVSIPTATALAEGFYARLQENGEVDRVLVEASAKLGDKHDVTVPALFSRLGGRPLWSDTLDRPLTDTEIEAGLTRLEEELPARAPILLKEDDSSFEQNAGTLRGLLGTDREALSHAARKEWDEALAAIDTISEEVLDLTFDAVTLGGELPDYNDHCPYRGLNPFREKDRAFFFGREALVDELAQALDDHPFLAVLGPSGSGKSSLVLAGLFPELQKQDKNLTLHYMTPGESPGPAAALDRVLTEINATNGPGLLVVDQFEELFTHVTSEETRREFLKRLLPLSEELPVVLTMRADFWGECAPYTELKTEMETHQKLIAPMTAKELRSAMEQQAGVVGLRFEADLANTILDDVEGEPGAMPLLQHGLLQLWKRRHGRWLKAEEYRAMGGVQEAIARTAEAVYDDLTETEQAYVRDIFLRLTRLDDETAEAEDRRDTRRRVRLADLVPEGVELETIKRIVAQLAGAKLVVTSVNETTGDEEVEVAHEALIRHWPRLGDWLDEDREVLRLRQSLGHDALEWEAEGRKENLLPRWNARLEQAMELRSSGRITLNKVERDYLDAAKALDEKERQRELEQARKLAREQKKLAEEQEKRAEAERQRAAEQEKLAEAQRKRAEEQEQAATDLRQRAIALGVVGAVAILLALAASWFGVESRNNANIAATNEAVAKANEAEAEANAELAATRETEAEENAAEAQRNADLAATREAEAVSAQAEAEREARRARAQGLAGEALFELSQDNGDRALLLARASFLTDTDSLPILVSRALRRTVDEAPIRHTLEGHTDDVISVAWRPDGTRLATASDDGTARVWDPESGETVSTLESGETVSTLAGHSYWVLSVAWSPDGTRLATASFDGTARVWDAASGAPVSTLEGHTGAVESVAWSSDGTRLATASRDGTARVWTTQQLVVAALTERVCNVHTTDEAIRSVISNWRGCEAELAAVAEDLERYKELQGE